MNQFSHLKSTKDDAVLSASLDGSPASMSNVQTSKNLMQHHGKDEWIASQRASLAKIFHVLDQAPESKEKDRASFGNYSGRLMISNRQSFFSKTPPESEQKAEERSSRLLWREDIPGETERLQPLMSVRAIKEIDGGALLPTLTVCGNWNKKGASQNSGDGLATAIKKLPTLCARDYKNSGGKKLTKRGKFCLPRAIKHLPTLLKQDGARGPTKAERPDSGGPNLHTALRRLRHQSLASETIPEYTTGYRLTPEFAEWWMGWPIRWTALKPVVTDRSRSKQR